MPGPEPRSSTGPSCGTWVAAIDPTLPVTDVDLGSFLPGDDLELDVAGPDDPALLPYTSGTTGTPKGALLSHGNLLASAEALVTAWRWTPDDRLILCLPLFHMHGLGVGLHGSLLAGASIVLQPSFDPERVLAAAADPAPPSSSACRPCTPGWSRHPGRTGSGACACACRARRR